LKATYLPSHNPFALGTQGQTLVSNGTTALWGQRPYIKASNTQTAGTGGGAATTGSFQVMPLNTKDADTATIASLCTGNGAPVVTCTGANQIVLPAGTYTVRASMPFCLTGASISQLYNVTGSAVLLNGSSGTAPAGNNVSITSLITGEITLASTSAISIRYRATTNTSGADLGEPTGFATEVYAQIEFIKVT